MDLPAEIISLKYVCGNGWNCLIGNPYWINDWQRSIL
jgi:hypothetical protein